VESVRDAFSMLSLRSIDFFLGRIDFILLSILTDLEPNPRSSDNNKKEKKRKKSHNDNK